MEAVRSSCSWVAAHASHVAINAAGIEKLVEHIGGQLPPIKWDFEGIHYFDNGPLTAQYMLVLDTLNFCFWPDYELQYDHLAAGLAEALKADPTVFDAHRLKKFTGTMLRDLLQWPRPLPLEDERVRLVHEVGTELERSFDGQAANLVAAAKGSAVALVDLVTKHFPGFRDHSVYKGHQVFIYKRAQIFVADLWGAFKGQGLGEFKDISSITMFADYVVPAVLRHWGILTCSQALVKVLDSLQELPSGSEEEVELRACTITAVERLREYLAALTGKEVCNEILFCTCLSYFLHIVAHYLHPAYLCLACKSIGGYGLLDCRVQWIKCRLTTEHKPFITEPSTRATTAEAAAVLQSVQEKMQNVGGRVLVWSAGPFCGQLNFDTNPCGFPRSRTLVDDVKALGDTGMRNWCGCYPVEGDLYRYWGPYYGSRRIGSFGS